MVIECLLREIMWLYGLVWYSSEIFLQFTGFGIVKAAHEDMRHELLKARYWCNVGEAYVGLVYLLNLLIHDNEMRSTFVSVGANYVRVNEGVVVYLENSREGTEVHKDSGFTALLRRLQFNFSNDEASKARAEDTNDDILENILETELGLSCDHKLKGAEKKANSQISASLDIWETDVWWRQWSNAEKDVQASEEEWKRELAEKDKSPVIVKTSRKEDHLNNPRDMLWATRDFLSTHVFEDPALPSPTGIRNDLCQI